MKFLKEYRSVESANLISSKFDRAGILTHVLVNGENNIPGVKSEELTYSLWVVLEKQYDVATAFLLNENYKVENPLSYKEIQKLKKQAESKVYKSLNWAIGIGCLLIPVLLFIGYYINAYNK